MKAIDTNVLIRFVTKDDENQAHLVYRNRLAPPITSSQHRQYRHNQVSTTVCNSLGDKRPRVDLP